MAALLAPTRRKLSWTLVGLLVLPGCFLLRAIPAQWDLLDLRNVADLVLGMLLGVPIRIFDAVTDSAFAARSEGFLGFPSIPEVAFALCANVLLFYVIACLGTCWHQRRRDRGRSSDRTPPKV